MKPYTIIRIEKIKTRSGLVQRMQHNERTKETPNADEARLDMNHEYVNVAGEPILDRLDARTAAAGVGKPRANATLCVEILMTASPEAEVWQRAPATAPNAGDAVDMRSSQWEADVVSFARKEWGENLLSLQLHQDEKTPHFQAFVVPIVGAGGGRSGEANPKDLAEQLPADTPARRSARDLFTPRRLAQLQTDFSVAMEPHGFTRGIAGSRAHHKTMGEMYGLLDKTATDLAPALAPVRNERFVVESPLMNVATKDWRSKLENQINAALDRLREEANAKLALAGQVAIAAAGGNEAAERSREWVEKEKKHKTDLAKTIATLQVELVTVKDTILDLSQQLAQAKADATELVKHHAARWDNLALNAAQGALPAEAAARGKEVWQVERTRVEQAQQRALAFPLASEAVYHERMRAAGYHQQLNAAGTPVLVDERTGARFKETVRPGGAEALPLAEQIARAVQFTEKFMRDEQASNQASYARRLAADRESELKWHRETEFRALHNFGCNLSRRDNLTARVRVPSADVAGIVQNFGTNIATADVKPGQDGLTGINLRYNPQVDGQCTRISAFLKKVETNGGEVYESANAQADRRNGTGTDRSIGPDYGLEQSSDLSM
jgi:Plasmid recombination enzyme